jgi:hypothetical protein
VNARALIFLTLFCAGACSNGERRQPLENRVLAISFPGYPNPINENLVQGTGNSAQIESENSPESQISEAFLRCGLKQLHWTSMATDGGSEMDLPDNIQTREAVKCVSKIFPLNFYVKPKTVAQ